MKKRLNVEFKLVIKNLKNDLQYGFYTLKSLPKYHGWIDIHKPLLIPTKEIFEENSIPYDLEVNTQDYFLPFIYIGKQLEFLNIDRVEEKSQIRLFNIVPLRTNIIPKHITFDTCGLIQTCLEPEGSSILMDNYKKIPNLNDAIWNEIFDVYDDLFLNRNRGSKRKHSEQKKSRIKYKSDMKYDFHHMIKTDGISVSILFIKLDSNGKPLKHDENKTERKLSNNTEYIEKVEITDEMRQKKIVCADPNKRDLIYCGSRDENGKLQTFRYTQDQRRFETRAKKQSKIHKNMKTDTLVEDEKNVQDMETEFGKCHNKKTNSYDKFFEYVKAKNELNIKLFDHYQEWIFRKFKLNSYINNQKSENKMIRNFRKKFGSPEEIIFVIGDFDQGNHHMKGLEPTILKRIRKIFRRHHYILFLVNEYKTSKTCNGCKDDNLEPFLKRESKNPKHKKKLKSVHGLLRCQNVNECEIIHNRDKNAVQNMLDIVESVFTTGKRPDIFTRPSLSRPPQNQCTLVTNQILPLEPEE